MNEQLHRFGKDARLSGVLHTPASWPDSGNSIPGGPAVIFITAGLLHRTGPFRLYVDLSRTLAGLGLPALRFDLSGIGESRPCKGEESAEQSAVTDVREAMDALTDELGVRRFVLAGLCSGAEVAHRTAVQDERVCGVIAMDGYIVRTPAYYWHHYLPRVTSLRKWLNFIGNKFRRLGESMTGNDADENEALAFWDGPGPDRGQLAAEFQLMARRDIRQLQIFSGGSGDCSYERQFQDAFADVDFRGLLTVRFLPETDHVYILHADRRRLVRTISRWLSENFSLETTREPARLPSRHGNLPGQPGFLPGLANTPSSINLAGRRNIE